MGYPKGIPPPPPSPPQGGGGGGGGGGADAVPRWLAHFVLYRYTTITDLSLNQ
jgi:hypothetical protein